MVATTIHPAMPLLRQAERTLATAVVGGLDQLSAQEISELALQLKDAGLEQVAGALQRAVEATDRGQRAGSILRAFTALGLVRHRLAEGTRADLAEAPLLSERSHLYILPLPAGADPETLDGSLTLLKSANHLHRLYGAARVGRWGEQALPGLQALAQKKDTAVTRLAARCISQIEGQGALDTLVKLSETLDLWREVSEGLIRRGQAVIPPLEKALGNPNVERGWLLAKVLWRVGGTEALRSAYRVATTPKLPEPEAEEEGKKGKSQKKGKPKKPTGPVIPDVDDAFEAYQATIDLTKEQVIGALGNYRTPTGRAILVLIGVERGWVSEDDLCAVLDSQDRDEMRISLRHVYGTPAHSAVQAYYTRMLRAATKHQDRRRAQDVLGVLEESGLGSLDAEDEDEE